MFKIITSTSAVLVALASVPAFATGYTDWRHYSCGLECGKSALPGTTYYIQSDGSMSTVDPRAKVAGNAGGVRDISHSAASVRGR